MPTTLSSYYQQQREIWVEQAKLAVNTTDAEAIHKFRTTTKRLRVFFPFLKVLSDNRFLGNEKLRKTKSFYQLAGRIRELQIEQLLISEYEINRKQTDEKYKEYLSKRLIREMCYFAKTHVKFEPEETLLPTINEVEKLEKDKLKMVNQMAKHFYQKKSGKINQLTNKPVSGHRMHRIRKYIKQLYYFEEFIDGLSLENPEEIIPVERLREMEQYIGKWHDLENSQRFMQNYSRTRAFENTASFRALKQSIVSDRDEMRKTIVQDFYPELRAYAPRR